MKMWIGILCLSAVFATACSSDSAMGPSAPQVVAPVPAPTPVAAPIVPPILSMVYKPMPAVASQAATFTMGSKVADGTAINHFTIDFGDGTVTPQNGSFDSIVLDQTYKTAGVFAPTLSATTQAGATTTTTVYLQVVPAGQ
jgi:hypothetical protein